MLFPSPGDLRDPGIEHKSPALQANSLPSEPGEKPSLAGDKILKNMNPEVDSNIC